jgi:hypothetical protein
VVETIGAFAEAVFEAIARTLPAPLGNLSNVTATVCSMSPSRIVNSVVSAVTRSSAGPLGSGTLGGQPRFAN